MQEEDGSWVQSEETENNAQHYSHPLHANWCYILTACLMQYYEHNYSTE